MPLELRRRAGSCSRVLASGKLRAYLKEKKLEKKLGGLAALMAPHAGRKVVSYHGLWIYLFQRFALVEAAKVEPKPGIAPSPRHLAKVAATIVKERARVVVHSVYHPAKTAARVAERGDAETLRLGHMPGALKGTATYVDMLVANVKRLAAALERTRKR